MFFHLNFVIFQYIHHSLRVQSIFLDIRKNTIFNKHPIPKKASLYSSICCSVNSMSPNLRGLLSSTLVTYDTRNWRMEISGSEGKRGGRVQKGLQSLNARSVNYSRDCWFSVL